MDIKLIDGFETLTKQQMFDMSLAHVRSTRKKSTSPAGLCVYGGIGCAASVFFADEESKKKADNWGKNWSSIVYQNKLPEHEAEFIDELQMCHDQARHFEFFMADYESQMERVANRHSLKYSAE